jgi:CheY-like chemotaxis protein
MRKSILVVEHEPLVRDVIAAQLRSAGYDVVTADDAGNACLLLEKTALDLVFYDPPSPNGNSGAIPAGLLQEAAKGVAVVLAGSQPTLDEHTVRVAKPFSVRQVLEAVRGLIPLA